MLEALSLLLALARSVESLPRQGLGGLGGLSGLGLGFDMAPDIAGPYCARADRCCQGRVDECSVPILGTLCYCDSFCNRTAHYDCCPDYFSHCHGYANGYEVVAPEVEVRPPPPLREGCFFNGRHYSVNDKVRSNCNDCQCIQMQQRAEMLCSRDKCMIDSELVEVVNNHGDHADGAARARWTATNYTEFWGRSLEDGVSLRLGTLQPSAAVVGMPPIHLAAEAGDEPLPSAFDARSKWSGLLAPVQDQGWCGASWALSTAAVASDRYAIMSLGMETPRLSPQHLLDCNNRKQHGCNGGHLDRAWFFTRKFGLVPDACYPWTGSADKCRVPKRATLQTARCPLRAARSRRAKTELYRMGPAYRLAGEHNIMREILRSGPVQATMRVYHDLFSYRSGVYEHVSSAELSRTGYHSVRLVGWGEEAGIKYWIVANSWGEWWGEGGYFRVRRGINEANIEDLVLAAWAHTHAHKELDNSIVI